MLYWILFELLAPHWGPLRLFGYVTFRTAFAALTALLISWILGPFFISRLRRFQFTQYIREEGPRSHQKKAGTPTMGGLLIITSIVVPTLLWTNLRNFYVWIALFGLISYGAIGFLDDYTKVVKKRNLGLSAVAKFALQCAPATIIGVFLLILHAREQYSITMNVPFFKSLKPDLVIDALLGSPFTYPLAFIGFFGFLLFILAGSANAVNLTDGLDGLASGLMIIAAGAMTVLCYVSGHRELSTYLELVRLPGAAELSIFCAATTGAAMGFLWFNAHPAEVFMGDVGSLALGGAMGTVAVLIKQELLLPFVGGVYVVEAMSVILQVASFRFRGRRVFLMAPLHHHFEQLGWDESKVITRFWIVGLVMALFALTTLKLR
ncbi:MAG: phospho-N-acetylmuramoyl-pentapeptide-transferase [Acidobacteriota bacterium]